MTFFEHLEELRTRLIRSLIPFIPAFIAGWMLREVGNRDIAELRNFLSRFAAVMPRTMLRYAIEKLDADERKVWMGKAAEVAGGSAS